MTNFSKNQYDLNQNITENNNNDNHHHDEQGTIRFRSNDAFDCVDLNDDVVEKINHKNDDNDNCCCFVKRKPHAFDRSNIISKLYCLYAFGFLWKNHNNDFDIDSFDNCARDDECQQLGDRLQKYIF